MDDKIQRKDSSVRSHSDTSDWDNLSKRKEHTVRGASVDGEENLYGRNLVSVKKKAEEEYEDNYDELSENSGINTPANRNSSHVIKKTVARTLLVRGPSTKNVVTH